MQTASVDVEVVTFGPDRPPRPRRRDRWWIVLVTLLAAAAVTAIVVDRKRDNAAVLPAPPLRSPIGTAPCTPTDTVGALAIDPDQLGLGGMLVRRDEAAVDGPWTVVVRRPDGSLGRHGAVVTFPVDAPPPGRRVDVNAVAGVAGDRMVVWPIAGAHARVRGDLSEPELLGVASTTAVVDGRPVVRPFDGLNVISTGPYRPPSIHEVRYRSSALGEADALGDGIAYTRVAAAGGFEDQLYARPATPGGVVHCRPAVVSGVFGGSASLVWEPLPGTVAFIGYSGVQMDAKALAAMQRLAGRSRVLSASQWRAAMPEVRDQNNDVR